MMNTSSVERAEARPAAGLTGGPPLEMTAAQVELARHALGLTMGRKRSYRNHFCARAGHSDYADWRAMSEAGWARHGAPFFWLTRAGAHAVLRPGESLDPEDFPPFSEVQSQTSAVGRTGNPATDELNTSNPDLEHLAESRVGMEQQS